MSRPMCDVVPASGRRADASAATSSPPRGRDVLRASPVLGGKAERLVELQEAGFQVPPFLVSPVDLESALRQLGTPVVVRSSATCEDGPRLSFAGQFRSFLSLSNCAEVAAAIEQCRRSSQATSVRDYCRHHRVDPASLRMAVIVQRMVQPELSGVAFTVNPVTGQEEVVVEACLGLSEELLAGRTTALPSTHPLLARYRPLIERTARAIARHYGAPQDVEFAIEGGRLYVLQARPITRIQFAPEIGIWTNADFRDGGVSSSVCSPLMWSLYELAWNHSLKMTLRELRLWEGEFPAARMFFGRPYWNLGAVKRAVSKLPGFVERDFDNDLSVAVGYDGEGLRTPVTVAGVLRAIPTLLATRRFFQRQGRFDRRFLAGGYQAVVEPYEPLGGDVEERFGPLIQEAFLTVESNYFRTIFAASLAKLDLLTAFPEASEQSLLASLPPLRHLAPVRAVQELPARDADRLDEVITRFRYHYRQGLDLCLPRWDEDRDFVTGMLRELPPPVAAEPRHHYQAALAAICQRVPWWRRRVLRRKLDRLRTFLWLREEMRDLSSQMYYLIRRYALEIARRRGLGDEIFFLSFADIVADDRSRIEANREVYESYRNFRAPNEIGAAYQEQPPPLGGPLRGLAASGGTAKGRACIAGSVAEAADMQAGQILICPFTDPGWTPVLDRAAGVVAETGGLLSHSAVICREYGIPAVLGVAGATTRIRHGQTAVVQGDLGIVHVES
jgi:phosphohistidine swiveling domain-containing protein